MKRLGARYHGESLAEKLLAGVRAAGDAGLTRAVAEDTYGNNPASVRTNLSKLVKAGIPEVFCLNGGMSAWQAQSLPVVGGAATVAKGAA